MSEILVQKIKSATSIRRLRILALLAISKYEGEFRRRYELENFIRKKFVRDIKINWLGNADDILEDRRLSSCWANWWCKDQARMLFLVNQVSHNPDHRS